MKLATVTDKRIVQAALTYATEGDDVLWDDLSEADKARASDLIAVLDIELAENNEDEEEEWEDEDEEDEEEVDDE